MSFINDISANNVEACSHRHFIGDVLFSLFTNKIRGSGVKVGHEFTLHAQVTYVGM